MSQVDNRNSSASKRARTDGGRREDDWTCPSCANVNFSFRTTCNMRNCTQPRPADHISKSAPKPMQAQQGYSPASPYGAPSSMYVGVPPYGAPLFNGSPVPPYDVRSAYHYNYGNRVSGGSPYRPLQFSAPPPYSGGSMIGGMYGLPQLMERFGLTLPMGHTGLGPRPGFFPEEKGPKKDGKSENDWTCPKCGNNNFSFRTVCNMRKCGTPKPGSQAGNPSKSSKPDIREGSWKCDQCNNINYSFRTKCNRQNCGAEKPSESQNSPSQEAEEFAQVCFVIYLVSLNFCCLKIFLFSFVCTPYERKVKPLGSHLHTITTHFDILPFFGLFFLKGYGRLFVNLRLSTVPVSTRTCLRRSRVVVQLLQSMGLKVGHVMVVVVVVFMLLRLSSYSILMVCVVYLYSKFGICGLYRFDSFCLVATVSFPNML